MKFYTMPRAPNPRRVTFFMAEKNITGIEEIIIDLGANAHNSPAFLAKNPLAKVPVLELDDGRVLSESRAICTYLEGRYPEPNLMGYDAEERAFIEMADRQIELSLFMPIANCIRHSHPGFAPLEQPQFADFGASQAQKMRLMAHWLDTRLTQQDYIAGARFTIADITAFCALEFARGLMKYQPGEDGLPALQAWRDRISARPGNQ